MSLLCFICVVHGRIVLCAERKCGTRAEALYGLLCILAEIVLCFLKLALLKSLFCPSKMATS